MVMNQQSSSISRIGALGGRARKRWRNERGFTLIEVIVSIALVLVAGPVSYTHLTLPTICSV